MRTCMLLSIQHIKMDSELFSTRTNVSFSFPGSRQLLCRTAFRLVSGLTMRTFERMLTDVIRTKSIRTDPHGLAGKVNVDLTVDDT